MSTAVPSASTSPATHEDELDPDDRYGDTVEGETWKEAKDLADRKADHQPYDN